MHAGVGLLVIDVVPLYMIIAMNNVITMRFSINCPIVICLPTVCYFSREKPLVKPTAHGSLSHIICLCDLFYLPFISDLLNQKYKNTLLRFILIYYIWRLIYQSTIILSHVRLPILRRRTRKGLTTPLTRRVARCCCLWLGLIIITRESPYLQLS